MKPETARKILEMNAASYAALSVPFSDSRFRGWNDFTAFTQYVKDGAAVLDVGCGNGRLADFLKTLPISSYVGVDLNPRFIKIAKEKFGAEATFCEGDILGLDHVRELAEKTFDVVFCIATLNHIPGEYFQIQALEQLKKMIKKGGYLCMLNWNLWRPTIKQKSVWKYARERMQLTKPAFLAEKGISKSELAWRDLLTTWQSGQIKKTLYYRAFTGLELCRLLRHAGFQTESQYYSESGRRAHWWDGHNILTVARLIK